jgi:alpha-D-ribose 1-methylphosphonate 5-triphosphate synthase subunit PhnH
MIGARLSNIGRGFSNPVLDSQTVFRAALQALSNPGRLTEVFCDAEIPALAYRPAAALLLAVLDADTTLWVSESLRESVAPHWLAFHTGCQIVSNPSDAQFAWISHYDCLPEAKLFAQGSAEYPDQSTSCVYELPVKVVGPRELARPAQGLVPNQLMRPWWLSGPGLQKPLRLWIDDLPQKIADEIANFRSPAKVSSTLSELAGAPFERRIDLFLSTPSHLIGLPRSTHLVTET